MTNTYPKASIHWKTMVNMIRAGWINSTCIRVHRPYGGVRELFVMTKDWADTWAYIRINWGVYGANATYPVQKILEAFHERGEFLGVNAEYFEETRNQEGG